MPEIARDGLTCVCCQDLGSKKCSKCHSVSYCSPECQRQDWTRHKRLCVPAVIAQVAGKGRGLLASRDIKAGELILKDKIVVTWPRSNMASEEYLLRQIEALPKADKEAFWQLTCMKQFEDGDKKSFQQAIGILRNNTMTYNQTRDNVDLCLALALINNSCSPNCATNALLDNPNIREVRAVYDIKKGEEITVTYENVYMYHNKAERQKKIKENWDFDCICERCERGDVLEELELKASLDRLSGMMQRVVASSSLLKVKNWEKMVEESVKEIELLQQVSFAPLQLPFDSLSLIKNAQLARRGDLIEKGMQMVKESLEKRNVEVFWKNFARLERYLSKWSESVSKKKPLTMRELQDFVDFSLNFTSGHWETAANGFLQNLDN